MSTDSLLVVSDAPTARGALRMMRTLARSLRPSDAGPRTRDGTDTSQGERLLQAQWVLLRDYEERELPSADRHSFLTATRWVELSAEHGTDGLWDFGRSPAEESQGPSDGLPVPAELHAAILAWNREFESHACADQDEDLDTWGRQHDARGRELATALRQELKVGRPSRTRRPCSPLQPWTVLFTPIFDDTQASSEQRARGAASGQAEKATWRFGLDPSSAPPLAGVYDLATLDAAMNGLASNLARWHELQAVEDGKRGWPWGTQDVLAQQMRSQTEIILGWCNTARYEVTADQRRGIPRTELDAVRFVRVMAGGCGESIWTWQGHPARPQDLPCSRAIKARLQSWTDFCRAACGWEEEENRLPPVDPALLHQMGRSLAKEMAAELPGWDVHYGPDGTDR